MPTTNKLQVVYKDIDELIPYARNPKKTLCREHQSDCRIYQVIRIQRSCLD